jgi:hypothetical protein
VGEDGGKGDKERFSLSPTLSLLMGEGINETLLPTNGEGAS